jgi:hypothetical protein
MGLTSLARMDETIYVHKIFVSKFKGVGYFGDLA